MSHNLYQHGKNLSETIDEVSSMKKFEIQPQLLITIIAEYIVTKTIDGEINDDNIAC